MGLLINPYRYAVGSSDIAYDAYSRLISNSTATFNWTHTPVGTPAGAYVFVVSNVDGTDEVTGVTYGGVAMTEHGSSPQGSTASNGGLVHFFYLNSGVLSGARTVEVTLSGGTRAHNAACWTVTKTGAPIIQDVEAWIFAGPTDPHTLSLGGINGFCIFGVSSGDNNASAWTPLTNWTQHDSIDMGNETGGFFRYNIVASTDVSSGYNQGTANSAAAMSVAVQ